MRSVRAPIAAVALMAGALLLFASASPALAQNPYPPGPATTVAVQKPTPPSPVARPVRGRVAFTGGNFLRWGAVALMLVAVGGGLVVADRRRGRSRA